MQFTAATLSCSRPSWCASAAPTSPSVNFKASSATLPCNPTAAISGCPCPSPNFLSTFLHHPLQSHIPHQPPQPQTSQNKNVTHFAVACSHTIQSTAATLGLIRPSWCASASPPINTVPSTQCHHLLQSLSPNHPPTPNTPESHSLCCRILPHHAVYRCHIEP